MFPGVLARILSEICIKRLDTTRKSRSVVFLAERLDCGLGSTAFVGQLKPRVLFVAFGRKASSFVWGRRIEDGIDEYFACFLAQT